ncbi:sensor histidine kinase [Cohnella endophytica]|uniref:Sensor histidine kinase n=1 Tax=Cohnella endophytica TaxID=2419778 RepID=A0A494XXZ7_9BACL|nr:sensor histidine kinase [Cohnella endophytica]RKP52989.1 sensor histidine kinase [Cohnella endophytica]
MIFRRWRGLKFRNYPLVYKLIVTYILLTVVPMSLLVYVSYTQYARSVEEQIGEYMPKFLYQANADIEKHIQELTTLPEILFNSENILSILRRTSYEKRSDLNKDQYNMNSYLARTYTNGRNADVLGVFVVSNDRVFYSSKAGFKEPNWTQTIGEYAVPNRDPSGKSSILLPADVKLHFDTDTPYVFIRKPINDDDNRKSLGTMLIAVDLSFIDDIVRNFETNERADLWVMDPAGRIVYHTDRSLIGTVDREKNLYPVLNGSFRKSVEGEPAKLVSVNQETKIGWVLVHSIPLHDLTQRADLIRNVTIFVFIAIVIAASAIAVVISYNMTRPLKKLSGLMKTVEMGDLQVDLKVQSGDEVGTLARSFNSMIATIRELIHKNYQIEIRQKEAELYALQSQINPHFMYNTLETIGMAVEEGETEQVVDMVTLLGRMLRFSVSNQSKSVTIAEEVQHVRDYLTIQKFRFEERVHFEIVQVMTDKDLQSFFTPKFILQPIVENAIKYGLETRKALDIHIAVSEEFGAKSGKRDIVLRIRDNGPGIEPERLSELEQSLKKITFEGRDAHFGLNNVNSRIVMMHGTDYGLQLHSIVGKGTEVIIRIPKTRGEELPNADD